MSISEGFESTFAADTVEAPVTDGLPPAAAPFSRTEHGQRVIVNWRRLANGQEGQAYECREAGAALVTFGGRGFGRSDTCQILGSNDGETFNLLTARGSPGAITLHALPLYIRPVVWGSEETEIDVGICLGDAA